MILTIGEGQLYYETSEDLDSTKKPILFVLPGGPDGAHGIYKFHSMELEEFFCVVYHDPRGCGKSEGFPILSATMTNYIKDIELLRQHLGLKRISLLGTSYGSMCAMGYAINHSAHLDRLILIGGAASHHFLDTAKTNLNKKGTPEQIRICENLWNGSFISDEQVREFMRIMRPLYSKNTDFQSDTTSSPAFSYQVLNNGFGNFLRNFDFQSALYQIECETLIMVGEEDWINDPIHLKLVADKIPNSRLVVLKDCAHFVAIDQHETYIRLIKEMVESST